MPGPAHGDFELAHGVSGLGSIVANKSVITHTNTRYRLTGLTTISQDYPNYPMILH